MRRPILLLATIALALMMAGGVAWVAEGGGAPALAATTEESALCQNPQRVLEPVTETGDSTTNAFTTTTNVFRVNYDGTGFDPAPPGSIAHIRILDEASQPVPGASETIDANAAASVIFILPPGTYRVAVDIDPQGAEAKTYIVSVDQCSETTTAPTTKQDCKNGGYAQYGFKNQGQCIKAVKHAS